MKPITSRNDAFGQEIWACFNGGSPFEIVERDDGYIAGQIRIRIRFQAFASPWFDYLFVSPGEMKEILTGTGWKATQFIEGGGASYVAVIEKV
jgi:hypothetical protein